jgi:hypothetical protein
MFNSLFLHFQTVVHCFREPPSIVIPSTVREIGEGAFNHIMFIEDLSFEEGLVRIGAGAFSSCDGFMSLAFPASLEVIGKGAFARCPSLHVISFAVGSRLRCIGMDAFALCRLHKVVLPVSQKFIQRFLATKSGRMLLGMARSFRLQARDFCFRPIHAFCCIRFGGTSP